MNEIPQKVSCTYKFENNLGGFLGLGKTKSFGFVDFGKNVYYMGE